MHIITPVFPQCKTSPPTSKATGTRGLTPSGTMQGQSWFISQENQIGLEQMMKISMNLGFFQW